MKQKLSVVEQAEVAQEKIEALDSTIEYLKEAGLLKLSVDGSRYKAMETFEEQQAVLFLRAEEIKHARQLAQENQQLQEHQPDKDRRPAGNQLQAIDDWI